MKRREFIKTTAFVGLGLAVGISGGADGKPFSKSRAVRVGDRYPGFNYPRGGCTESGVVMFDAGPRGKDPFGFTLQS